MLKFDIYVGRADDFGCTDPAPRLLFHQPGAGDMIRVAMRIDCVLKLEIQFPDQSEIPSALLENGIDNDGLAGALISNKICIRRGGVVEKLTEDHLKKTPVRKGRCTKKWGLGAAFKCAVGANGPTVAVTHFRQFLARHFTTLTAATIKQQGPIKIQPF